MKITPESMKKQYEDLWNTFCKKNHDYGSSFEQSLDKHGLIAGVVRMEDKMNRISTLVDVDKHSEIASESLADTLRDLSNYSAMAACWLDGPDDVYNEENLQKIENHLFGFDEAYARHVAKMNKLISHSHYGVKHHSDGGLTVFYKNGEDDKWGDDIAEGFSGSVVTTMGREEFEKVKDVFHLASFEGHQEKVNERAYYERDGISDEEIIKNWGLVGDDKTVRSRTTGQYLVEDDNPELFHKILYVLKKNPIKQWTDYCVDDVKETLDARARYQAEEQSSTELKGLENGYVIRQHKNSHNSHRYTLAFNPEGTLKVEGDVEKPYVIECFSYADGDSNTWALHVFDTREDMVAALNYDFRVRRQNESINFGDSIKELDVKVSVFTHFDVPRILDVWEVTFGEAFNNQMLSKDLNTEESIEKYHGIKTFGPVFISEKTGALVIKGTIREDSVKRPCDFIWFGDTKEVLLEVDHTLPKFNYNGIIHGVTYNDDKYVRYFNPLYDSMSDKIMSKFYSLSVSEVESDLKNLVFFNEDDDVESTEDEPNKQSLKQCIKKLDLKNHTDCVQNYSNKPLLTDPLGLENGYFIRQHTNHGNSDRYTLAFNPEGTVRVPTGEKLPYVIECFGNDYDGMTGWAIHVFHSREDMVSALNYDLKVSNKNCSKRFRDSIGNLDVDLDPFDIKYAIPVTEAWSNFFGPSFVKNMTTDNILNKSYYGIKHGVKTFGPLFISEKTGALVVKGRLRERTNGRIHNSWDESKLKNLVFLNEDDDVESGKLTSKNEKLQIDFTDSEAYWDEIS